MFRVVIDTTKPRFDSKLTEIQTNIFYVILVVDNTGSQILRQKKTLYYSFYQSIPHL